MYDFITGPLLWASFSIFFFGLIARIIYYFRGLDWKLDRVAYKSDLYLGLKGAAKSVFYWLVPFGSRSWRLNPGFTVLVFVFHTGLLGAPIFLYAHNMILKKKWGISFWTLSESAADILTILTLASAALLLLRRVAYSESRIVTSSRDYFVMIITTAPFITGFICCHQLFDYDFWIIAHILSGHVMLVAIPFTKLSHMVLFFLSRIQLGMDFGIKRGGAKGGGMVW